MSKKKDDDDQVYITLEEASSFSPYDDMTYSVAYDTVSPSTITINTTDTLATSNVDGMYTISLDGIVDSSDVTFDLNNITITATEFKDVMPELEKIDNMCDEYPALKKAYDNFKTIYKMCEQDYKGKLKERGLDDDIPF